MPHSGATSNTSISLANNALNVTRVKQSLVAGIPAQIRFPRVKSLVQYD